MKKSAATAVACTPTGKRRKIVPTDDIEDTTDCSSEEMGVIDLTTLTHTPKIHDGVLPFGIVSCLNGVSDFGSPEGVDGKFGVPIMLRRCLSIRELGDESWLSSSLIDLAFCSFAKYYTDVYFLPIDFVVLAMSTKEMKNVTDIIGRKVDFKSKRPIVFICNAQNIHWNMIRIIFLPQPEVQLFEPMGKPSARRAGLNFRSVPRGVITWLDVCHPLPKRISWQSLGVSAILKQQQVTAFDCGVACLLYAEKCGLGQVNEKYEYL
jgi:hypothetical protein